VDRPWVPAADGARLTVTPVPLSAAMTGIVTDHLGLPVAGAKVSAWHKDLGLMAEATTDARGAYALNGLPAPGPYALQVAARSFLPYVTQQPFAVAGGKTRQADLSLAPATATITVRLARPLWGYAMTCTPEEGLRLLVRTRPVPNAAVGKPLAGLRVMLDAGHGGASFGERGPSGLLEKDINLVQVAWLQKDLEALGAEVRQTRTGDVDIDLDKRVDMALAWPSDLFISLHHNSVEAAKDPLSDSGPIVFYHYLQSEPLASAVAEVMAQRLDREHGPRARTSIFRVNRNVSLCPSVLVESAYICNPYDEFKLRQTDTLKASAQAIAAGVVKLFSEKGVIKKT
jgi:N-acetylmuramoyl-L-alanine amidase